MTRGQTRPRAEGPTATAAEAIERRRAALHPEVPAGLVAAVYELEHSRQSETERGPTVAEVRDLIRDAADR